MNAYRGGIIYQSVNFRSVEVRQKKKSRGFCLGILTDYLKDVDTCFWERHFSVDAEAYRYPNGLLLKHYIKIEQWCLGVFIR